MESIFTSRDRDHAAMRRWQGIAATARISLAPARVAIY